MLMKCKKCGKELKDDAAFCNACGEPVSGTSTEAPNESGRTKHQFNRTRVVPFVASLLAVVAVGVIVIQLSRGSGAASSADAQSAAAEAQSATTEAQSTKEQESKAQGEKGKKDEGADKSSEVEATTPSTEQLAADAYEAVLNDASSYFAEEWYRQYPDSEISYTLVNLTDDDLPELLLSAHYSNVGSHTSGGTRMIPFVYDAASNKAVEAKSEEFSFFMEPYSIMNYSADDHAFLTEWRSTVGKPSEFYKQYVKGTSLVSEPISADQAQGGEIIQDWKALSDRAPINELRGGSAKQPAEQPAEQAAKPAVTYETDDFIVTLPDFLADKFSVDQMETGSGTTLLFSTDVQTDSGLVYGGALIVTDDGSLPTTGRTYFGCASSGKHVYSEYGLQGVENLFISSSGQADDTLAKVQLK